MSGLESFLLILILLFILGLAILCFGACTSSSHVFSTNSLVEEHKNKELTHKELTNKELTQEQRLKLEKIHPELYALLGVFIDVANEHKLVWWAGFGTLLGCIREGRIIEHDDDVDICITSASMDKLILCKKKLKERGYELKRDSDLWRIRRRGSKIHLDLFVMIPSSTSVDNQTKWIIADPKIRRGFPNHYFFQDELEPFISRPFKSCRVQTPKESEIYLERQYGLDWRTPKITHYHHLD